MNGPRGIQFEPLGEGIGEVARIICRNWSIAEEIRDCVIENIYFQVILNSS